nr:hypothetical protein [Tanacetum cinerariifolium]
YMDQQIKEAVREAVQIQTDRLQDSLQRENDEFLRNIDENMKKVLKGLVKNQVKEQEGSMHWLALHLKQLPGVQADLPQGADDQPIVQTSQHPEWFSQPKRPPSPDRD